MPQHSAQHIKISAPEIVFAANRRDHTKVDFEARLVFRPDTFVTFNDARPDEDLIQFPVELVLPHICAMSADETTVRRLRELRGELAEACAAARRGDRSASQINFLADEMFLEVTFSVGRGAILVRGRLEVPPHVWESESFDAIVQYVGPFPWTVMFAFAMRPEELEASVGQIDSVLRHLPM